MNRKRKGWLIWALATFITAAGDIAAAEHEWLYIKNLCMMLIIMTGPYIWTTYHQPNANKPAPKRLWIWELLTALVMAGAFTWADKCNGL